MIVQQNGVVLVNDVIGGRNTDFVIRGFCGVEIISLDP